jgi:hypothetical protein
MRTGIRIEFAEGINYLIEDNIMRDIDPPFNNIKALEPLVQVVIPKKDTLLETELKLMGIKGSKVWPTGTSEGMKATIVWFFLEQQLKR